MQHAKRTQFGAGWCVLKAEADLERVMCKNSPFFEWGAAFTVFAISNLRMFAKRTDLCKQLREITQTAG